MINPRQLCKLYRTACEIELQTFKPGNVSIYAEGHDMTVNDFRISAEVSAEPLCNPGYSLGEKIYFAVKSTRDAVGCNTNLGIILLCAPLIQAGYSMSSNYSLRQSVSRVIAGSTVGDANWVFKAITLAAPGGLGNSGEQDVRKKATATLLESMKIAAGRDRIAFQYSTNYQDIFDFSLPLYYNVIGRRIGQNWAALEVYARLLCRFPDSHILRKYGDQYSRMVSARMTLLSESLDKADNLEQILPLLYRIDREFKSKGVNPGTTADLTVATVLTALLEDEFGFVDNFSQEFC